MESAERKLVQFMYEMKRWEDKFFPLYQEPNGVMKHVDEARSDLKTIYDKYLTKKVRLNGKIAAPSAGYPTEFDPDAEKIVNIDDNNPKNILIETIWVDPDDKDFSQKQRYTLVKVDGNFLIDKKEIYVLHKKKWESFTF